MQITKVKHFTPITYLNFRQIYLLKNMLELHTKTFEKSIAIPDDICASFKKPLVFYLKNKHDVHSFFITFVILDFQKKILTYITSYLPENILATKNYQEMSLLKNNSPILNPHCTISTKKNEEFLVFFEVASFFFRVNYHENTLMVYTGEILGISPDEKVLLFSPTNFKDEEDPDYFYFSALIINKITQQKRLELYRGSLNLSKTEHIHTYSDTTAKAPHVVRKIGRHIISSDFLNRPLKNLITKEVFEDNLAYMRYVYQSLYKEYCEKTGIVYSDELFEKNNHIDKSLKKINLAIDFDSFCLSRGKNFLDICKRNHKYSFETLPGSIMFLDLETKKEETFSTTFCAPAHFEIDEKTGDIFVSSHNFSFFDKIHFFGPAAIDRFSLREGKLVKVSTFSDPTGYRFTSHRVFHWKDKTYICTFGEPNRLFFIDAKTMTLDFFEDIEGDLLSNQIDIAHYLNHSKLEPFRIVNIEVSPDGQFIFFINYNYIYIYSFPKRKIMQKMRHNEEIIPGSDTPLSDFRSLTIHANYLS